MFVHTVPSIQGEYFLIEDDACFQNLHVSVSSETFFHARGGLELRYGYPEGNTGGAAIAVVSVKEVAAPSKSSGKQGFVQSWGELARCKEMGDPGLSVQIGAGGRFPLVQDDGLPTVHPNHSGRIYAFRGGKPLKFTEE